MATAINGKLLGVTVNGVKLRCQTDATLTIAQDTESGEACKDDNGWVENFITSKNWSISVTAKAFLDNIQLNQADLIALMLGNTDTVEVEFLSDATPGVHSYPENQVFAGDAIISNFDWSAPVGESTYTIDFTGTGAPTFTRIPVTT